MKHLSREVRAIYPFCLFILSFGLITVIQLRSPYIVGVDSHEELFVFDALMSSGTWNPSFNHPYTGALGATILPAIISEILGISGEEVFKYISSIVVSIVPVVLFLLYRKVIFRNDDQLAFLSCLVFIFNYMFFIMPTVARQSFAFLSLASTICVFFNNNIKGSKKGILVILFAFATIMLHYSTGILLTFTIVIAYLLERFVVFLLHKKLSKVHAFKMKIQPDFRFTFVVLMLFFLIFYLSTLVVPFKLTINAITAAITNLGEFLSFEAHSYSALQQLGVIPQPTYSYYINFAVGNIIRFFIVLGLFASIFAVLRQRNLQAGDMTRGYHLFAFASLIFVFLMFVPKISMAYNLERVYLQSLTTLAAYFPVGIASSLKFVKLHYNRTRRNSQLKNMPISDRESRSERKNKLMMLAIFLLLIQLLSQTGTFSLIEGNAVGPYYLDIQMDRHYTLTQEVVTTRWIVAHSGGEIIFVDWYSKNVLKSYGNYTRLNYVTNLINGGKGEGIIYIRYIEQRAIISIPSETLPGKIDRFDISDFLKDKDLIYSTQSTGLYEVLLMSGQDK